MSKQEQALAYEEFFLLLAETRAELRSTREDLRRMRDLQALDTQKQSEERVVLDKQLLIYASQVEQLTSQLSAVHKSAMNAEQLAELLSQQAYVNCREKVRWLDLAKWLLRQIHMVPKLPLQTASQVGQSSELSVSEGKSEAAAVFAAEMERRATEGR
jgi:nitrate reductase alpha subunit